jgi:hypothetical protein
MGVNNYRPSSGTSRAKSELLFNIAADEVWYQSSLMLSKPIRLGIK